MLSEGEHRRWPRPCCSVTLCHGWWHIIFDTWLFRPFKRPECLAALDSYSNVLGFCPQCLHRYFVIFFSMHFINVPSHPTPRPPKLNSFRLRVFTCISADCFWGLPVLSPFPCRYSTVGYFPAKCIAVGTTLRQNLSPILVTLDTFRFQLR